MNRKGFDADFVLKFVLSIIGLALIIVIISLAYQKFIYNGEDALAKQTLSSLMSKADFLRDGENNTFIVRGVEGRYLVGWNLADGDARPKKCYLNNCVCICASPTKEGCDSGKGICMAVKDRSVSVRTEPFTLLQDFGSTDDQVGDRKIVDFAPRCIILPSNFTAITIVKSKTSLDFSVIDRSVMTDDTRSLSYLIGECDHRTIRS